mmetsp:Transcript_15600/g.60979  ORF Transcript_15600/g.60979 Transcript_15600/m.60979 type:complete len:223 (+) Transcript_15600:350-1018(+)|eukprot:CAMPEP_0114612368 /NCGR_PEP_ID=MMETSP0168-20121206/4586_1 /TAXON_ID=95228 ORGANISM="Vannella sp., Strain DIVA3 517/6/12" /NCGR_SAMPLE_ID=MMETSP0168 /ASSEMBLY_ACC=CAM_ASM_000044 /LENGTH=222 /DNA_ID=CAMNT_0001823351 /DNA_START=284 /DNA_END=952 /DNA_ORIENTATION=+
MSDPAEKKDDAAAAPAAAAAENGKAEEAVPAGLQPQDLAIKHPLHNSWSMWYDNPGRKTSQHSWGDHLRQISTFSFVEDFWRVYNNIHLASKLASGSNYHLFKQGIEPKWEDEANKRGGKWIVQFPSKQRKDLDKRWLWCVLALVGENLDDDNDEVCGAVVSIRRSQDKIAIWTKDKTKEGTLAIGRKFKAAIEWPDMIGYQSHSDAMKHNSSFNNRNKYEV